MKLSKGDVLLAGPYKFVVENVKGRFVKFVWNENGTFKDMWVCVNKLPIIINMEQKDAA